MTRRIPKPLELCPKQEGSMSDIIPDDEDFAEVNLWGDFPPAERYRHAQNLKFYRLAWGALGLPEGADLPGEIGASERKQ
jgi:hypothetical protein